MSCLSGRTSSAIDMLRKSVHVFPDGSAVSAIDMLWQCLLETASAIDMLWRSRPSLLFFEDHLVSLLPGHLVFLRLLGFLIVLLLPVVWSKSFIVILSVCF